jgi:hypothetical protein
MTHPFELFLTENPESTDWELPSPRDTRDYSLIGWHVHPEPVDSGVPPAVAGLLARAICDFATISFLSDASSSQPFSLVSTTDPQVARRLFDEANYSWAQHGQVALLSARNAEPPGLTAQQLRELNEQRNLDVAKQVGFIGILLPGVDGDVAGLWVFDPSTKQRLIDAMRTQCEATVYHFEVLTEKEFREKLTGRNE